MIKAGLLELLLTELNIEPSVEGVLITIVKPSINLIALAVNGISLNLPLVTAPRDPILAPIVTLDAVIYFKVLSVHEPVAE